MTDPQQHQVPPAQGFPQYQGTPTPPPQATYGYPQANLDTNRTLVKYILLGFITLGIYCIWVIARGGEDLNMIASRYDNKRSMNFWLVALLLGPLTAGIFTIVWLHITSDRIGNELQRRGYQRTVQAADFWLWGVLGSLIIVGPFIFIYKWLKGMNELCADYNQRGN